MSYIQGEGRYQGTLFPVLLDDPSDSRRCHRLERRIALRSLFKCASDGDSLRDLDVEQCHSSGSPVSYAAVETASVASCEGSSTLQRE